MKPKITIIMLAAVCLTAATGTPSVVPTHEPVSYVLDKAARHDVVLLGTRHQQARLLFFISDLIPRLSEAGVTHIGLEIASDQQDRLDRFMRTGMGLSDIRIFQGIDCPDYRRIIETVRQNGLAPVALDLPAAMWKGRFTRDQWMAKRIAGVFQKQPRAKMLVIAGNLHTLKQVDWLMPAIKDQFARYYLGRLKPELRLYSVAASIDDPVDRCDFQKWFGRNSAPVGVETIVFDRKLGVTRALAAKPVTAHAAVDAVIVF